MAVTYDAYRRPIHPARVSEPAGSAFAITPNNSADLASYTRGVYVGAQGDLKVDMANGETVTFVGLAPGVIHPLQVKKVYATGTSATSIVGVL